MERTTVWSSSPSIARGEWSLLGWCISDVVGPSKSVDPRQFAGSDRERCEGDDCVLPIFWRHPRRNGVYVAAAVLGDPVDQPASLAGEPHRCLAAIV
jgi:hypothetical protein